MVIYGSMMCPDCVACTEALDLAGVSYTFCDFADDLKNLKEFLVIRDQNAAFETVKKSGKIGIPCIVFPDGRITLDWESII